MRPPPGGDPYFATSSGGAIMLDLPRSRLFMVVGTLSSSTQMYSGSLGTSPNRGFLIRSHFGSLGRRVTLGSFCAGSPASSRMLTQPPSETPATHTPTARRAMLEPFMTRPSIADSLRPTSPADHGTPNGEISCTQ